MPIYTYMCRECKVLFDVGKSMEADHPEVCPTCGKSNLYQKVYPPAIIFRGSGFYSTDKVLGEITDPDYQLTLEEQIEYYDEKLKTERTVRIPT